MRRVVGRRPLLGLLTSGPAEAEQAATAELRSALRPLDLGVVVHGITFQDVHPPLAVVDAYRDVSRAESDRQRRVNEAGAYRAEKLAEAEGQGEGDRERRGGPTRSAARPGRRARPTPSGYQLAAREPAPSLTDFRLYWEAIAEAFAGKPKLILDARADRPQRLIMTRLPLEQRHPQASLGVPARERERGRHAIGLATRFRVPGPKRGGPDHDGEVA